MLQLPDESQCGLQIQVLNNVVVGLTCSRTASAPAHHYSWLTHPTAGNYLISGTTSIRHLRLVKVEHIRKRSIWGDIPCVMTSDDAPLGVMLPTQQRPLPVVRWNTAGCQLRCSCMGFAPGHRGQQCTHGVILDNTCRILALCITKAQLHQDSTTHGGSPAPAKHSSATHGCVRSCSFGSLLANSAERRATAAFVLTSISVGTSLTVPTGTTACLSPGPSHWDH